MNFLQSSYTEYMDLQRVVAENLMRKRGKMSRKELADKAKVSYQHIYEIEELIKKPSLNVLEKVSKALKVDLSELLVEPSTIKRPVKVSSAMDLIKSVPDDFYWFIQEYEMDDHVWDAIKNVIETTATRKQSIENSDNAI